MNTIKFLDLSGFGASGKGAVIDLLREFNEKYCLPHYSFEFALLRIKNGLVNLYQDLIENWSPSRSDTAIKQFIKLTTEIAQNPKWFNLLGRVLSTGMRYNHYFNNEFINITRQYTDQLIKCQHIGLSSYPFQNRNKLNNSIRKLIYRFYPDMHFFSEEMFFTIYERENFLKITNIYLEKLFKEIIYFNNNAKTMVLLNACEPYNPKLSLDLLGNAQQIIIDRDPRDLYLSTCFNNWFSKTQGLFSGSEDIKNYVYRYRTLRERSAVNCPNLDSRILMIYFEDLVLDYDKTRCKIYKFLGEDATVHINPKKYFKPEDSMSGVGLWKNTQRKFEIDYIYEHLKEYCRDY